MCALTVNLLLTILVEAARVAPVLGTAPLPGAADFGAVALAANVVLLLVLVVLSGIFSGSETVLFTLTSVQIERAAASANPFRRLVAHLLKRPKEVLRSILVVNTAVNVLLFATSFVLFQSLAAQAGPWVTPVSGVASILLVVVFGEVVPKVLAVKLAERLAPLSATVVRMADVVAGPVGKIIDVALAEPFVRVVLGGGQKVAPPTGDLSRAELKALLELSRRGGTLRLLEDSFLRAVLDLGHTRVREVMVPRVAMRMYDVNESPEGLRTLMRETRYKKIPVYDGTPDAVVGMVYAKVLFLQPDRPLQELVQPVRFVPELITCERLLAHFRESRTQLAITVDEYGGVAGLVTLEDVLERIVGEIDDTQDREEPDIRPLESGDFDISGGLSVHYWVEAFRLPPRVERVATVGGLVMAQLGRPAQEGDRVRFGNIELEVIRVAQRRIERLRLRLLNEARSQEADGEAQR